MGVEDDHGSSVRPDMCGLHFLVVTDGDSTAVLPGRVQTNFIAPKFSVE